MRAVELNGGKTFNICSVEVIPESIPAGFDVVKDLNELDSLLIIDLGGTTLDVSQIMGKMRGISRIFGDSSLGISLMTSAVKDTLSVARTKGSSFLLMTSAFIVMMKPNHEQDFVSESLCNY
ncbi:hypothetical protein JD793_004946 [Citrobacter braakii]|nr:hypothetical protein [Citrobacter braakii]